LSSQNSITNAENSLATAQKELENLKISQENAKNKALQDLDNSKKDLDTAKINLEILKKEKDQSFGNTLSSKNTTIKNTEDSFKSYLLEIEKINTDADYVL
jgi:predicted S18 family serine protease